MQEIKRERKKMKSRIHAEEQTLFSVQLVEFEVHCRIVYFFFFHGKVQRNLWLSN